MPMTITEADHVNKLIAFVTHGDLYTGQAESARAAARSLEYLGERAEKVLKVSRRGDLETYARRLAPLAAGAQAAPVDDDVRAAVVRRIMRILDYGKTGNDPELAAMNLGQMADRIIAVVRGGAEVSRE